jgi:hypothetical protein
MYESKFMYSNIQLKKHVSKDTWITNIYIEFEIIHTKKFSLLFFTYLNICNQAVTTGTTIMTPAIKKHAILLTFTPSI